MQCALALCGTLALSACASKYAQVPPRLDLEPYGRVALVTFSSEQSDRALNTLATQRFVEMLLASQSHVEVLELPASDSALASLAASGDGAALAQAVGRDKAVPAVFVGHLTVSDVKPRGRISAQGVDVRGSVAAQLTVRLLSTTTGATVWRSSATASRTVGNVRLTEHNPSIAMRDPDEAYGDVVRDLVTSVTRDLRPTWVKQ